MKCLAKLQPGVNKLGNLNDRISALSEEQKALLKLKLQSKLHQEAEVQELKLDVDHETLSFSQKRLWFQSQLDVESAAYNIPSAFLLLGDLNPHILERCFYELVERHEILRTNIVVNTEGEPRRNQLSNVEVTIPVVDLTDMSRDDQRKERTRIVQEEIGKPISPTSSSVLWRLLLIRLNQDEHYLVITMHHLIFDGWSVTLMLQELSALYTAFNKQLSSPLEPLTVQYSDYVTWQKHHKSEQVLQKQLKYWSDYLEGAASVLELPTTYVRPSLQTFNGASYVLELSKELNEKLKNLCVSEEATPFMVTLAIFKTLLYRYTEQSDITLGVPVSGRNERQFQQLIGVFVNTLPIRTVFSEEMSFRTLLRTIKMNSLEAFSNQDIPFEDIVQAVQPNRSASMNSLCQVLFTYQKAVPNFQLDHVLMNYQPIDGGTSKFDLSLDILDGGNQYPPKCIFEYNTDLFDFSFMKRMASHFEILLERISADPDALLGQFTYLTPEEINKLKFWQGTTINYSENDNFCTLFEKNAMYKGDSIALSFNGEQVTYRELHERSSKLSTYLIDKPVEAGSVIGICLPKSIEFIVAVMGILKAGAAFLPMDPSYPTSRLEHMVVDSKMELVVTRNDVSCLDFGSCDVEKVLIEEAVLQISTNSCTRMVSGDDLAYVIYTSGSTGLPKGTMVTHRNLIHAYRGWEHEYRLSTETTSHLQMASLSFDVFVGDVVRALGSGSKLVLCPSDLLLEPSRLYKLLYQEKVDCAEFVPAVIRGLMQYLDESNQDLDFMKLIIVGSDTWTMEEYSKLRSFCANDARLISSYGLTEATIDSSYYEYQNDSAHFNETVPIGKPFPNTQLLILDRHRQEVPIGITGELYIAGDGVAKGYIHKSNLSKERFLTISTGIRQTLSVYKTGDLARYLADGNIELVGRSDFQVKIRGYRIEISEIEKNILHVPGVSQCVVVVKEDKHELKYLVGYIICGKEAVATSKDVRDYLKKQLPDYMVPSSVVVLEEFPLTSNGKVNRLLLPTPTVFDMSVDTMYVQPRTELEEIISGIWKDVFGVSRVGIQDDFFELGGYSLLAMKIVALIRKATQVELPLQALFQAPTVEGLAETVASLLNSHSTNISKTNTDLMLMIHADPINKYKPFPLTDIQHAYWIGRNESYELGNVSTHSYDEYEAQFLDIEKFENAWNVLIKRHDMLRTVVTSEGMQKVLSEVPFYQVKVTDLRGKKQEEIKNSIDTTRQEMSHQMLNPHQWPVFDIRITLLEDQKSQIHFSTDAIMWDVWSFVILMRELVLIYTGKESELSPLEISFRDYVMAQQEFKKSKQYKEAFEYWKTRVPTMPPSPELPLSRNPTEIIKPKFVRYHEKLDIESWTRLKTKAMKIGITTTGILLTAFAEVIRKWSKNPDFSLNLTFLNRNSSHAQINQIVGEFTSVLLFEVKNNRTSTFIERARQIQNHLWNDLENNYISGVDLIRELNAIHGGGNQAKMPVVFTSALVVPIPDEKEMPFPIKPVESLGVTQTSQVWLDCGVWDDRNGLYCNWDVVEEMYPPGFIKEMFHVFWSLVKRLAENDEVWNQRCIPLVPMKQLERRNETDPRQQLQCAELLHTLFNKSALIYPNHPAIISSHNILTYDELFRISNQIGRQLRSYDILPNHLVAIYMNKGWEQVAGVLGVMQAGAAYLPIDPDLPEERLRELFEFTDIKYVLTTNELLEKLRNLPSVFAVAISEESLKSWSDEPLDSVQASSDLAYTIFTSGTSGKPKGVMIDHAGAVNTIMDVNRRFAVDHNDKVLALSAFHFDLSVYDIFGSLAAGATIIIPDHHRLLEPAHWEDTIKQNGVTIWNSVPSLMAMYVEHLRNHNKSSTTLRLTLLSGDWIPLSLPSQIRSVSKVEDIVSLGGATEASIWSIFYRINEVEPDWKSIPYGKALSGQKIYVLSDALEPCPDWVTGQIYIGGVGLAKGYFKNEEATKSSFLYHANEHIYRTGDLGRYLPDGNVEFLGRADMQLKIQGYRINPNEICYQLLKHPLVDDAVVLSVGEPKAYQKLVAYYRATENPNNISDELRSFLALKLPKYMIPVAFVRVESYPLNANNKIDYDSLRDGVDWKLHIINNYQAPSTALEKSIAAMISNILQLPLPGVRDTFYELGGDSLQLVKLLTKLREYYSIDLLVGELLQNPTIEKLAICLNQKYGIEK
ncbi:amino acid adenylation domain-containing protein [Paenibacillus amylolyticus]|uniref:Amino acid adenylation domain-containing protein n=1 Tax=Paenibacillus amylolyticus TaxID=1451 RepID=A0A5M9WW82_PAEAM|nr:non-ribosomal peptide synthetase [Paenibacillus amylolyticus]KAA8785739.1 amino acid adenylation domain-containing protein [Paenibacillus amylolyticus]